MLSFNDVWLYFFAVKQEDGRYVIINSDGRQIPLKVATKESQETKKYVVKCTLRLFPIRILSMA
jgi:hypothetical protein